MAKLCILLGLALFVAAAVAQSSPPNLNGRWDDTVCHLITNSDQLYERRTIEYGPWSNEDQQGSWEMIVEVWQGDSTCDPDFITYRITYLGTYTLTGAESEDVPFFWNIEYNVNQQIMVVFTSDFVSYLDRQSGCNIGEVEVNVLFDIADTTCVELNILPIVQCPVQFDIVRREANRIWVGEHFYGCPPSYVDNCLKEDRPTDYDPYGLATFVDNEVGSETTFDLDPFVSLYPSDTTVFDLTAHLGLTQLQTDTDNSSSSQIVVSLAAIVVAALFAL
mmetsp:Transcript_7893/g.33232  ORF Transcript_7893/g.33232 Transcript_7893/m.33232 type:complete len:277 (+) Transcript_7893:69-899(+)